MKKALLFPVCGVCLGVSIWIGGCGSSMPPAPPASVTETVGTPQSATVNTAFAAQFQATVKDSSNKPVSGATVTFAAPGSGASGTFAGGVTTATTNASGVATAAVFTANTVAGSYTVTASVSGVPSPANFSLTNLAGAASSVTATAGTPQSATANTAFATQFQATVKDSFNNPVSGATVTFSAPGSGASGTFAGGANTAVTNTSGVATAPLFTANTTVGGPYTVTASVSGVPSPANFSLTNLAGAAASVTATAGTPQSATINTAFATQLQATVKDSFNNSLSGVTVAFIAPGSGASGTFAGGVNTAVTNASGVATAPVFTANTTAGGPYTVTASVSGVASPANFSLTNAPVTVSVNPQAAAIGTGQTTSFTVTTNDSKGVLWSATDGTIDGAGNFTAPSGQSATVTVTATSVTDPTKSAGATVNVVAPGTVAATANGQVALYTIAPAAAGNVSVQFGTTTTYGLTTWTQPVPSGGGPVPIFVAGMTGNTLYHMQGIVQFSDGSKFLDADQTFTTQGLPTAQLPAITVTTTAGMTPQSGVEMLDMVAGPSTVAPVAVTDISGNILWSYNPGFTSQQANPMKLLPDGHFMINFSSTATDGANSILQEVDLTGAVIWQMTAAQLNTALAASCSSTGIGCNLTVLGTHHDFVILPSGHLIVIASTQQTISGAIVTGDVIIDLLQNFGNASNPATVSWLWNEFDHLDVTRQPMGFPDWTHTNAVIYSADDGNLIISIRHQNWLVKFDYSNGTGDGHILWKLGYQGDFTLLNPDGTLDTNTADWFWAQHGPSFVTTNTTGKFSLTLFDNGDDRVFPSGVTCGTTGAPPCVYSTVPILQLDETVSPMTATLAFHATAPTYSFFGGNAAVLKNGNVEYCESAGGPGTAGDIYEVTQTSSPQTVWQMVVTNQFAYRGQRIPSFYPGVQW